MKRYEFGNNISHGYFRQDDCSWGYLFLAIRVLLTHTGRADVVSNIYSRFQIDGALSENSLGRRGFGNSHRQKCRALLEPYLFFRNVLEIKKKKIKPVIPILPSTPLPNFFSESAPSI